MTTVRWKCAACGEDEERAYRRRDYICNTCRGRDEPAHSFAPITSAPARRAKRIWEDGDAEAVMEGSTPQRERELEHVIDLKVSAAMARRTADDAAIEADFSMREQRAVNILVAQKVLHMTKARK